MDVLTGANVIPRQVIALTAQGGKMVLGLPHNTSVLVYQDAKNIPRVVETVRGVRAMPLALALCRVPPAFFENQPLNAEIALRAVKSVDDLARVILETGSPALAGGWLAPTSFSEIKRGLTESSARCRPLTWIANRRTPLSNILPLSQDPRGWHRLTPGGSRPCSKLSESPCSTSSKICPQGLFPIRKFIWGRSRPFTSMTLTTRFPSKAIRSLRS